MKRVQDTEEELWLRQGHSLSKEYLRLTRSHPGEKWGKSVSGRRNGICEGPKAELRLRAFQKVQGDVCGHSQEWERPGTEQGTLTALYGSC